MDGSNGVRDVEVVAKPKRRRFSKEYKLKVLTEVPWWQFLLWLIAVGLFAWAAHRLLTGRVALKIYSLALAIDLAFLAMLKMAGARSGHSGAIDPDYIVAAVMALVVLAIRAAEHRPKAVGDAAHNPD